MSEKHGPWYRPGTLGIVFSVQVSDEGTVTLLAGDVKREDSSIWRHEVAITRKEMTQEEFFDVEVTEGVLADIGLLVISRLASRLRNERTGSGVKH